MSFSPRQSPFKRPDSPTKTPSTVIAPSPTMSSPTKGTAPSSSPMLGSERQSPFVRRPSQLGVTDRPKSPFARAPSRLSVADTPDRESSYDSDPFVVKSPPLSSAAGSRPESAFNSRPSSATDPVKSPPLPSTTRAAPPPFTRTQTSSTVATVRPLLDNKPAKAVLPAFANASNYTHIPPALLRSMRESFEVLDTTSSNAISRTDLASVLEQLGLDASPQSLATFFPPSGPQSLTLARFLDMLAEPMKHLSEKDELTAAFAAFDVDDSGQIDVAELRDAVLRTAPDATSAARLSDREVDNILAEFTGRRAFGAKGVSGKDLNGGGRGEVFRYRDFMATISGAGHGADGVAV